MIGLFQNTPLDSTTKIDRVDVFVGTGSQTTFALQNLTGLRVGNVVQVGGNFLLRNEGAFTISGNNIIFASPPALNAIIVVSGINTLVTGAYDQDVVEGEATPRVKEEAFWIGDVEEIHIYRYLAKTGYGGIEISFYDQDSGNGVDETYYQLADSDNGDGAGTYGAAGDPLEVAELIGESTLDSEATVGTDTVDLVDASDFISGRMVIIEPGQPNEEKIQVDSILSNTLTMKSVFAITHPIGSTIYECAIKVFRKYTVPTDANSNQAVTFYDTTPRIKTKIVSRV